MFQNEKTVEELFNSAMVLVSSPRPQDSGTATYLLKLLLTYDISKTILEKYVRENNIPINNSSDDLYLNTLQILLWKLRNETTVAKSNFIEAAATGPLYGVLYCIRNILVEVQFR